MVLVPVQRAFSGPRIPDAESSSFKTADEKSDDTETEDAYPFDRFEYVARRGECMDLVTDDDDWDAVMGCTEWPNVFPAGSRDGSRRGTAAAETAAAAIASAAIGGGVLGGWWWREERRRASGFRRHVVLGSEFEDA